MEKIHSQKAECVNILFTELTGFFSNFLIIRKVKFQRVPLPDELQILKGLRRSGFDSFNKSFDFISNFTTVIQLINLVRNKLPFSFLILSELLLELYFG